MSSSNNTEATVQKLVIRNNHEWDPLEEVVVGLWVPNTLRMPTIEESVKATFPYITQEAWNYLGKAENKLLSEACPADDQLFCDEQEALVQALQSLGVKVRRPDEIEFPVIATSSCYSRDPIVTIGNKTIITNMNLENRRQETPSYRRIALELATQYNGTVVSMPPNKAGYPDSNAYLEGGDVFVDGKDIYVGVTGNASNDNGIAWLREELGSDYTVHKVPLNSNVLHLDCAMMLINERQGLICKEDFVDFDALPDRLKNRQWVEVEPKQAQVMATNGICVNPTTIMMRKDLPR